MVCGAECGRATKFVRSTPSLQSARALDVEESERLVGEVRGEVASVEAEVQAAIGAM